MPYWGNLVESLKSEITDIKKERDRLREEVADWEQSFGLYNAASRRAIKMWHDAGNDTTIWPDTADLIVWMAAGRDRLQAIVDDVAIECACQCDICYTDRGLHAPGCLGHLARAAEAAKESE